jgi:hypothetical protein
MRRRITLGQTTPRVKPHAMRALHTWHAQMRIATPTQKWRLVDASPARAGMKKGGGNA